jgi:hypothetical protein
LKAKLKSISTWPSKKSATKVLCLFTEYIGVYKVESMQYCTYIHHKPDNSIFYIGKGSIKRAYSPSGRNVVWNRIVKKHGGFKVQILAQWLTEQEAFDHEIFLIDTFCDMGYQLANIAKGGSGSTGFRHTDEHKKFKAQMMRERNPMSNPEFREKQKVALKKAMNRPRSSVAPKNG